MGTAVSSGQVRVLGEAVCRLAAQAEACAVVLTDIGGNVLAHTRYVDDLTLQTLGALGAGSFSATRELAALAGESVFYAVSHEGAKMGIHVRSVRDEYLLIVIFDKTTTLGLVKLYTEKTAEEIIPVLRSVSSQSLDAAGGSSVRFEMSDAESIFSDR